MKIYSPKAPKYEGERCLYSILIDNPNSTTAIDLKKSAERGSEQATKCVSCPGSRRAAVRLKCWSYMANINSINGEDIIIRSYQKGFYSSRQLNEERTKANNIEVLEKELRELKEARELGCLGEGGVLRLAELERMLGE